MRVWRGLGLGLGLAVAWAGGVGWSDPVPEGVEVNTVLVIAHRGARSVAPENTLAAAKAAWELGADAWEFDVQMTKDGELVLVHDDTLARTTNAREVFPDRSPWGVGDFTLEEIRCLDAGSWFVAQDPFGTIASGEVPQDQAEAYRGERIPTLREALLLTGELGLLANVELKGTRSFVLSPRDRDVVERTVALIRELGMGGRVIVSSFDHEMIRHLKRIAPEIAGALLVSSMLYDPVAYLREVGADALNPRATAYDPARARALRQAGFGVYVWTVNEPTELSRFAREPDVSGIITDWPQRLLAILGRSKG
ncbi:MAG: glycerophosphodiester phosphodiesterase [Candidatus Acetothermia bacterium]|nr:glycerophosphodiester phosphodiesterase [Candidatus Acetothermia bacterium]